MALSLKVATRTCDVLYLQIKVCPTAGMPFRRFQLVPRLQRICIFLLFLGIKGVLAYVPSHGFYLNFAY